MIADFIVIIVLALCIFLGYRRGLIKVAVRIIGFVAAILIALVFYTPVSNYIINNTDIPENLSKTIESKIYNQEEKEENRKVEEEKKKGNIAGVMGGIVIGISIIGLMLYRIKKK